MTDDVKLWKTLQDYLPKATWIPLSDILATVRSRVHLDQEDLERRGSSSEVPRWEFNLRRLLRAKTRTGSVRAKRRVGGVL